MSRSVELWNEIQEQIAKENLIETNQLEVIKKKILAGKVKAEDWRLALENTHLKEENNGQ